MSHTEKMLKEYEEKTSSYESGGFLDYGDDDCPAEINWKNIELFLLTSHLSYLLQSKKRLEGEMKEEYQYHTPEYHECNACDVHTFNSALTQQIAVLEREIKEVEELIKK